VFQVVLEPVGFTYVEDNNIIKIKSRQELATEPVETKVFLINSSKASEMVNSLSPLIDAGAGGRIQVDNRTNALVITERPSHMNNIQEIIERLDRPTQQVSIETKFVELNLNDAGNIGVTWNFDGSSLLAAGTAWQYSIAQGLGSVVGAQPYGTPIPPPPAATAQLPGPRRAADLAFFNTQQYNAILRLLETDQRARLVSNPTVVTLDNEEIFIHVGETIPIVYPTINNQTGNTTPGEREKIDTGVKLRVKPQVSNNGFINLTLNPEISRVSRSINYFGGDYPVIETRKLSDAKVSIKDGFTLALGGLIDDSDIKNVTKTPFLGDIPILGELFTERATQHNRRNLIIFLTAKTLNPDGATFRDVVNPNLMLRTDITDEEIPGYYDRSHPNVPGVPRATPDQMKAMQDANDARSKAIYDKQMKELQQITKEAKTGEATHLGKGQ
jgi:type IV pilus assembly protein PilQ